MVYLQTIAIVTGYRLDYCQSVALFYSIQRFMAVDSIKFVPYISD
jgi:hypothetical protein